LKNNWKVIEWFESLQLIFAGTTKAIIQKISLPTITNKKRGQWQKCMYNKKKTKVRGWVKNKDQQTNTNKQIIQHETNL
jgi:hypothetical protein